MNISFRYGSVWIDGERRCKTSTDLWQPHGMEIPEKQPISLASIYGDTNKPIDRLIEMLSDPNLGCAGKPLDKPVCQNTICQKCHQLHDPLEMYCPVQPKDNRTIGRFDIVTLLDNLAKRFALGDSQWLATIFHTEKENWK